jgi:hypothetical protein
VDDDSHTRHTGAQKFIGDQNAVHPYHKDDDSSGDQKQIVRNGLPCQNDFIEVKMGGLNFRLHGLASSKNSVIYSFNAGFVIRQTARVFHENFSSPKKLNQKKRVGDD